MKWLALLALEEPCLPDFAQAAAWYAQSYPDEPAWQESSRTSRLLTLTCGKDTAAVTLIDQPIAWSQLEGPAATAWYWPDASDTLRKHSAHLLVALADDQGKGVSRAMALTRLTSALVAASPCCGVFWGPGRLVHPPQAYLAQAEQLAADDLPLFLWVDFRIERLDPEGDGPAPVRLYTTGLEALGATELEAPSFFGEPQQLLEYAYNLAHYQLLKNQPIGQDDTIALTDEVQAIAHRGPSMLGGDLEVIRLEFA